MPRVAACRDTLPPALREPFLCGTQWMSVHTDELRHPEAISPEGREMAALPVYGRLSEIAFENYECLGMHVVVGVLRPLAPIGSKGMRHLQVTVRFRDGSVRVAKVKWDNKVSHFLHGGCIREGPGE